MTKITKKDIDKLADLARVELPNEEKDGILKDLESILGYISEIQEVVTEDVPAEERVGVLCNVMREDGNTSESGLHTKEIIDNVPKTDGNYIKVKKILS